MSKPRNETKAHNYILRSRYLDSLVELSVAIRHAQIKINRSEFELVKSNGRTVAGQPSAMIRQCLIGKGLAHVARIPGTWRSDGLMLTDAGNEALDGALAALANEARQRAGRCSEPAVAPVILDESYYLARIEGRRGDGMPHVAPKHCRRHGWHVGNVPCAACEAANDAARHEANLEELEQRPGIAIEPTPAEPAPWIELGSVVEVERDSVTAVIGAGTPIDGMTGIAAVMGRVVEKGATELRIAFIDWPEISGWYPWSVVKPASRVGVEHYEWVERDRAKSTTPAAMRYAAAIEASNRRSDVAEDIARAMVTAAPDHSPRNVEIELGEHVFDEYNRIVRARRALAQGNSTGLASSYLDEAAWWARLADGTRVGSNLARIFRLAARAAELNARDVNAR